MSVDFPLRGSFSKAEMIVVSSFLVKESVFNKVTFTRGINSSRGLFICFFWFGGLKVYVVLLKIFHQGYSPSSRGWLWNLNFPITFQNEGWASKSIFHFSPFPMAFSVSFFSPYPFPCLWYIWKMFGLYLQLVLFLPFLNSVFRSCIFPVEPMPNIIALHCLAKA